MINIFIINWYCIEDITLVLKSLSNSEFKNFRVIIINNSKSENEELIDLITIFNEKIEIHSITSPHNIGYSGGNNLALSFINKNNLAGDILISNSDITFNAKTIGILRSNLKGNVGAISPRIFNSQNKHIVDHIQLKGFQQKFLKTDLPICDTDYVPGCCFMIKREIVESIGLFDEKFFMYWEEVDLSLRILNAGYRLICSTEATINRKENSSKTYINSIKLSTRNSFLLKSKHRLGTTSHILYLCTILMLSFKKSFKMLNIRPIKSFFLGLRDGYSLINLKNVKQ